MKAIFSFILFVFLFSACKKDNSGGPASPANGITGKWKIITVTVIPHDSTGITINGGTVYTEPSYYYFQFNADMTWLENLTPDISPAGEEGNYVLHSDTSFTLVNANAAASPEECKIITLTNSSFVFSHQRPTLYNGVTPGFLEYIFKMQK